MLRKKLLLAALAAFTAAGAFLPVSAEGNESFTVEDRTANLTVKYFDDEEEKIPVAGAEFTIYQIAEFGHDFENNGKYLPLDETVSFINDETADIDVSAYEQSVIDLYKKNPNVGYKGTQTIGEDGKTTFKNIPSGAYLVTETKTMRYHIRPKSFVASAPEMNEESNGWNFDVTCNPKQILAGDLSVTKTVKGKISNKDNTYEFTLTLPEGTYRAKFGDGTEGTVVNSQVITLKKNQTAYIYDLPAGSDYDIVEKDANVGFKTTYTNTKGQIIAKEEQKAVVNNDSTEADMGTYTFPVLYAMAGVGCLCVLIVLLAKRKSRKQ